VPTWGQILAEVQASAAANNGQPDFDGIRRKYLAALHARTGRPCIIYYTDWLTSSGQFVSITLEDMQGMMEVLNGIHGPDLDIVLHSPGGSAEATDSIVRYLRTKFDHIRAFVPLAAMSAATMWALACDEIFMGKHSQLGPIDPQLVTQSGAVPAHAVIEQFERAKRECTADPSVLGAWLPILQQYGPALLEQCERAEELAQRLVKEWAARYMLRNDPEAAAKAADIAEFFASYETHPSHGMAIDRDQARAKGVVVHDLENDQALQEAVLSVHHATLCTLQGAAVKIVENHSGKAFVKLQQMMQVQVPIVQPGPPAQVPLAP
jgi:hypothetical protein